MSSISMTKEQMRSALISHGVTEPDLPPPAAKKEVWVALYEERVMPVSNGAAEFSSDDELSPTKKSTKASKSSKSPKKAVVEEDSMTVDGVDISALDDDELFAKLKELGISPGPIVGSTRKFYQRKLILMLKGQTPNTTNGNGVEYSDTEDEEEEEEEDDQPAGVVTLVQPSVSVATRRSTGGKDSNSSPKKSPAKTPVVSVELRHRGGPDSLDAGRGKLTPTPRRSIHSFRVSESSKPAVIVRNKEAAEKGGRVVSSESSGGWRKNLIKLLKLSAVLALLVALYLAFIYKNDEVNSFDEIIDAVNTAQTEVPPVDL